MLATNSICGRRGRFVAAQAANPSVGCSGTYLARPRLPLRCCSARPKPLGPFSSCAEANPALARMKRLKNRKVNVVQKMDLNKKKSSDYTEMAYREAVSKLKYLLAESYAPSTVSGKPRYVKGIYQSSSHRVNESGEDTDDRSMVSDCSRSKDVVGDLHSYANSYLPSSNIHPSKGYSNLALSTADMQSVPPELTSFIERQEEYIEQLERESQYCRDELTNLLGKVRKVVAENEELHNRNKSGFLKCALDEHHHPRQDEYECGKQEAGDADARDEKNRPKAPRVLVGPSIVFESRISELEAQLTQARLELRKAREENEANLKRLSEGCPSDAGAEAKAQLEQATRARYEAEAKLEELQRSLCAAREKEADAAQRARRSLDVAQQMEFEKSQCDAEIRRLKAELDRQHEKLREAAQEASRRVAEERQQAERRYSQQVEQLSADAASHWDAASKSQLESERQRRELTDLRRDLAQKQTLVDNTKKELQAKISSLQSELNQALTEKDASEQEVLAAKLAAERSERQARQEQSRLQAEINSYKQRLERADADLVHCRRENLRLSEQIASLEKEISMSKIVHPDEGRVQAAPRVDGEKELTSMIMDMETKHAATVAGLEDALSNQATLVSQLTAECQSLTRRLEANNLRHKEEMANLQSNIDYLSSKIQGTLDNQKATSSVDINGGPYDYDTSSAKPTTDEYLPPESSGNNDADLSQMPEEYDVVANEPQIEDNAQGEAYSQIYEENDGSRVEYSTNNDDYVLEDRSKGEIAPASEEYELQNEDRAFEGNYQTDPKDSYLEQQQNNQYDQYNPPQYQEEQYATDEQSKELHSPAQYTEQDRENDPVETDPNVESVEPTH